MTGKTLAWTIVGGLAVVAVTVVAVVQGEGVSAVVTALGGLVGLFATVKAGESPGKGEQ